MFINFIAQTLEAVILYGIECALLVATGLYIARLLVISFKNPVSHFFNESVDVKRSLMNQHVAQRL